MTNKIKRTFTGIVVSDKMDKTIVVKVDRTKLHKRYLKRYTVSRKYKVHDEKNQFKVGDKVNFIECRPISKDKMWKVIKNNVILSDPELVEGKSKNLIEK